VGRVRGPHGIHGEVVVSSYTDFPQRLAKGSRIYLSVSGAEPQPLNIESSRPHKMGWIIKFDQLQNRTEAETARNGDLLVPETSLHPLPEGRYYPHQLIGCEVFTLSNQELGVVKNVVDMVSNPLLEVEGPHGEILIPLVESIVIRVDLSQRRVTVDPPKGLIELNP